MRKSFFSIFAVLVSVALVQVANGLQTDLIGVRAEAARFSAYAIGLMMAGYYVGFSLAAFTGHLTIGRLGHVWAIALFLIVMAAVIAIHPFRVAPWWWTVLRFLSGFAMSLIDVACESWINDKSANEARGRVFSIYMTVQIAALTMAQYLFGFDVAGSSLLFFVAAALFLAGGLPIVAAKRAAPSSPPPQPISLVRLFAISKLGAVTVILAGISWSVVFTFGPVFAARVGFGSAEIGLYMALAMGGGALLQIPSGWLSDRVGRRPVIGALFVAGTGAALFGMWAVTQGALANLIAAVLIGGFSFPVYAVAAAQVNDRTAPATRVPVAAGILLLFGLGSIVGPMLCGWAMQGMGAAGYYAALAAAMVPGIVASQCWK